MKLSKDSDKGAFLIYITGRPERGDFMTEELNIVTPEGADDTAPSFYETIGNMRYDVVLHFADKGSQTVKDRLKRVILHEANAQNGTTNQ